MINLHERMLPTSAGVEPATSWSPVGRRIQLSHRGRLFKANNVFSKRFVKIYILWYANMLKFFAEKMWVAFAVQKLLTFFSLKNIRILYIESAKTVDEMTLN